MDYQHAGFNMQVDGDKFICMDRIIANNTPCIIYSFGINHEWSFEDYMDDEGCSIFAFDHTIDSLPKRGRNKTECFREKLGL